MIRCFRDITCVWYTLILIEMVERSGEVISRYDATEALFKCWNIYRRVAAAQNLILTLMLCHLVSSSEERGAFAPTASTENFRYSLCFSRAADSYHIKSASQNYCLSAFHCHKSVWLFVVPFEVSTYTIHLTARFCFLSACLFRTRTSMATLSRQSYLIENLHSWQYSHGRSYIKALGAQASPIVLRFPM